MRLLLICGAVYSFGWIGTWGGQLAYLQKCPDPICDNPNRQYMKYREDLSMTCLMALFPPMWFIIPFVTGFYMYGWMNPFARRRKD